MGGVKTFKKCVSGVEVSGPPVGVWRSGPVNAGNVHQKIYIRWPIGLLQIKKWIGHRLAAGVMMAVTAASYTRLFRLLRPTPSRDLISPFPCFNYVILKP